MACRPWVGVEVVRVTAAVDAMAKAMSEAELQDAITGMLDHYRIPWHHETDSRKSKKGLPDLIIFGRRIVFWELKKQGGRVTPEQHELLTRIVRAQNGSARVVRPMNLLSGDVQTWIRELR